MTAPLKALQHVWLQGTGVRHYSIAGHQPGSSSIANRLAAFRFEADTAINTGNIVYSIRYLDGNSKKTPLKDTDFVGKILG
jgi:hypothetical protein